MTRWLTATMILIAAVGAAQAASADLAAVIKSDDRDAALKLIQAGADVNQAQADGTTALHWAVYRVDPDLVKALLARGARPNATNRFGSSPLAEAATLGDAGIVKLLLAAGATADLKNADGETPLLLAAHAGAVPVAELLVRHGADVNAREQWHGQTALMWAAAEKHPDMVSFLLAHHASAGARSTVNDWPNQITSEPRAQYRPSGGLTALLYAVRSGCLSCVQALLQGGADINQPTPDGVTPLTSAIDNLNFDVASYLLDRGANANIWDWWGRTPLYVAVDMHSYVERFDPPLQRSDRTSALELVRKLLDAGVNPNPQLDMHRPGRGGNSARFTDDPLTTGATPLLRAAISFDDDVIRLLLEHGAKVDLPNVMGLTPLMVASGLGVSIRDTRGVYAGDVQARALTTIELLVQAGADVNARVTDTSGRTARIARPSTMTNRQGQTVIYGPISWGWTEVVRYLLAHGASVAVADAAGKTPLDAIQGDAGGRDFKAVDAVAALIRNASAGRQSDAPAPAPTRLTLDTRPW